MARSRTRLSAIVAALRRAYGVIPAPPARDAYRQLLWEQVAYLADDAKRLAAWKLLETTVGTDPATVAAAPDAALRKVTRAGGAIAFAERAARLRQIAQRVVGEWDGDLDAALAGDLAAARKELKRYPSVADAGADRILALAGLHATFGVESNGLRVLQRLGYGDADADWNRAYRATVPRAERELPRTAAARAEASLVLRHHGKETCKASAPRCDRCPVRGDCPTGRR